MTIIIILGIGLTVTSIALAILAWRLIQLQKDMSVITDIVIAHRDTLDIHEQYLEANENWATAMTEITDKFVEILEGF
jgi:hypothetical protein